MTYFEQKETDGKEFEKSVLVILDHPYNVEECGCTQKCSKLEEAEVRVQAELYAQGKMGYSRLAMTGSPLWLPGRSIQKGK